MRNATQEPEHGTAGCIVLQFFDLHLHSIRCFYSARFRAAYLVVGGAVDDAEIHSSNCTARHPALLATDGVMDRPGDDGQSAWNFSLGRLSGIHPDPAARITEKPFPVPFSPAHGYPGVAYPVLEYL